MTLDREVTVRVDGRTLDCFESLPGDAEEGVRRPAVVVVHEIFGPDGHIRDVARRIARLGYVVAAPDLFTGELHELLTPPNIALAMQSFAEAPPDLRRDPSKLAAFAATQPLERRPILEAFGRISAPPVQAGLAHDLHGVTEYLRARPEVDPARVASVGFCFGGAMSARLATVDPELRGAVIFYGQNPPFDTIPAIRARLLGLYGEDDPGITQTVPAFAAALAAAGKSFEYHVYPGAKHAFFNDTRPMYHATSAADAWDRVVRFFAETLSA
ncbi:MAG: dienelactone hydrolase family protein [Thermoplasmata archaeon]|jgi:carboxymethylenebutenolidase|nr:dienelactone hydrolase family protein [Thermoplasmata archaeon]